MIEVFRMGWGCSRAKGPEAGGLGTKGHERRHVPRIRRQHGNSSRPSGPSTVPSAEPGRARVRYHLQTTSRMRKDRLALSPEMKQAHLSLRFVLAFELAPQALAQPVMQEALPEMRHLELGHHNGQVR